MQPVGQVTRPHEFWAGHDAVQLQESAHRMSPHAFDPMQPIWQAASSHSMSAQALVPLHVMAQVGSPTPLQSMLSHAFEPTHMIVHFTAFEQSMSLHALDAPQVMVQSNPSGQSIDAPLQPGPGHVTRQVLAVRSQPALQSAGHCCGTQNPVVVSHTRASANSAQSPSSLHSKLDDRRSTKHDDAAATTALANAITTTADLTTRPRC